MDGWLKTITWDQLRTWIDFVDEEPIGEERADLRTGALATVIYNMNLDTKSIGGVITPHRYVSAWGKDHEHVLALKPRETRKPDAPIDNATDTTVNNPVVWENFIAGLVKSSGGIKRNG